MKKVIYFFALTLLIVSCNVTKEIYDDVYDQAELNPTTQIDKDKGYADYIKKEEKRYKVEPEEDHYSYISTNNRNNFNTNFSNLNNLDSDYYCYYHNRFHTHRFDTHFCSDWPNHNFSYYNNPYIPFGYATGCGQYTNYYGGFNSYGNYGCGNYWVYYWGGYGNSDPYAPWSVTYPNSQDSQDAYASLNHHYGHRNGTSFGTNSNNTTIYAHTVKKLEIEKDQPVTDLPFGKTNYNQTIKIESTVNHTADYNTNQTINSEAQDKPQYSQFTTTNHQVNTTKPLPVQNETTINHQNQKPVVANKPATNPFSKPVTTNLTTYSKTGTTNNNSGGYANSNSKYVNKYNASTNNNSSTTYKTNNTTPSSSTSRRTTRTTNSNNTTPSTNRGNSGSSTSGHRGDGGSGNSGSSSSSGSSRR